LAPALTLVLLLEAAAATLENHAPCAHRRPDPAALVLVANPRGLNRSLRSKTAIIEFSQETRFGVSFGGQDFPR
jgi:hypothetical protein